MEARSKNIRMAPGHRPIFAWLAPALAMGLAFSPNVGAGDEPSRTSPPAVSSPQAVEPDMASRALGDGPERSRRKFQLPGIVVDFEKQCVDVASTVCLEEGFLELIACTKGSKEHESIVAIEARPMHVHTALLLLGAEPGNPAMRKPVGEGATRWIDIPPRGDSVDIYLVFKDQDGKLVEHAISDFVARADARLDEPGGDALGEDEEDDEGPEAQFPHTFLFAGSYLRQNGPGPREYLSDLSGNVISISTFGDELLCLPGVHGQANDSLIWRVNAAKLPQVGSKVTLRLRPRLAKSSDVRRPNSKNTEPAGGDGERDKSPPATSAPDEQD